MNSLKTLNLIESVINEDKFSKYMLQQIFDELGKEGFVDYIEQLVHKVIKVENIGSLKNMELDRKEIFVREDMIVLAFTQDSKKYIDGLKIIYVLSTGNLWVRGQVISKQNSSWVVTSDGTVIASTNTNIFDKLRKLILKEYVRDGNLRNFRSL